ncbi:MAG: hypothetical protein HYU69_03650 [Bacteroidetes bacterium]|nr:hypothetical protein [Bacteroidota bacterium]
MEQEFIFEKDLQTADEISGEANQIVYYKAQLVKYKRLIVILVLTGQKKLQIM